MKHLRSKILKKIIIFFILAFILCMPVMAGGAWENIWNGIKFIAGVALAPFTYGASLVLSADGLAGLITSGKEDELEAAQEEALKQQQQQDYINAFNSAYNNYLSAQNLASSLQANISNTEVDIMQTEANISSFDQTLVRWQSQYDQQLQSLQMEGESAYTQLMQNWQGVELVNATRGQTGGSAALVAQSQLDQVERLAGTDLRLDENGGTYGTYLNEFRLDMLAGRTELVGNMNIQKQALAKYQSALSSYKSQLASAQSAISTAQKQWQTAQQNAIASGVDPSLVGA